MILLPRCPWAPRHCRWRRVRNRTRILFSPLKTGCTWLTVRAPRSTLWIFTVRVWILRWSMHSKTRLIPRRDRLLKKIISWLWHLTLRIKRMVDPGVTRINTWKRCTCPSLVCSLRTATLLTRTQASPGRIKTGGSPRRRGKKKTKKLWWRLSCYLMRTST